MKALLVALNAQYIHTNLAIRQIATAAETRAALREGWTLELLEAHINLPWRRVLQDIFRRDADLVAFSCYLWNIDFVLRLARALRLAAPSLPIYLGGPEVMYDARQILHREPSLSGILTGEGERAFGPLLRECARREGAAFAGVPGLVWRAPDDRIEENPSAPPLLPADWPDPYPAGISDLKGRILYLETSRGCPYHCKYCLSSRENAVRALSAEEAARRLASLAAQGARLIKLVDRTFNFDRRRANDIWTRLIEHARRTGVETTYHFEIGANLIDEAALAVLAQAPKGLFQFEVGIQSTNEEVLRASGRTAPFAAIASAVRKIVALGTIAVHVDLIAGLPGETMETFAQSFDDAYSLGANQFQLGFLKLLPGSAMRAEAEARDIVYAPDAPYEVIRTPGMRFGEMGLLKDVETLVEWYVNSGRYPHALVALPEETSPFLRFRDMAEAFREQGVFDMERGERARAAALYEYGVSRAGARPALLGALLTHDLLLAGKRCDLPEALAFRENDEERALLRARYHPVRGQSVKTYPLDVLEFCSSGRLFETPCRVLYDGDRGAEGCERLEGES